MLWGVELVTDRDTKERARQEAEQVLYRCLEQGLSFKLSQGNVIQLSPPLVIERKDLGRALDMVETAIKEVS